MWREAKPFFKKLFLDKNWMEEMNLTTDISHCFNKLGKKSLSLIINSAILALIQTIGTNFITNEYEREEKLVNQNSTDYMNTEFFKPSYKLCLIPTLKNTTNQNYRDKTTIISNENHSYKYEINQSSTYFCNIIPFMKKIG